MDEAKAMNKAPSSSETLVEAALRVLNTPDPFHKAKLGDQVATLWLQGTLSLPYHPSVDLPVPDRPARLTNVSFLVFLLCPPRIR